MNLLKNKTRKEKRIIVLLTTLLIFAIIFAICSKRDQSGLAVYMTENTVSVWDNEDSSNLDIKMRSYANDKLKLGFAIPEDWAEKTLENGTSFTHEKSGSVFTMEISDYDPSVNNMSASNISSSLVAKGYTFINFIRLSANSYQVLYQENSGVVNDYIKTVYWDRSHIVTLSCEFSDANYQGIIPYFDKIISSFKWTHENPIPSGYAIYYNPYAKFEIAIPETWVIEESNSQVRVNDQKTGAMIIMELIGNSSYLDSFTSNDMIKLIQSGKSNFMMRNFTTSKTQAYAICSYTTNGKQVISDQYVFADGTCQYLISVHYYSGTLDSTIGEKMANTFKSYHDIATK